MREREYLRLKLSDITPDRFVRPSLVDCGNNVKVYISESDLMDYPGMYLKGADNKNALVGKYPAVVLENQTNE
ncbi:MAG: glycoside hydrolase family 97 N-terminal domain-containing protein [Draconibacterium sp.]